MNSLEVIHQAVESHLTCPDFANMPDLELAQHRLVRAEQQGRFYVAMSDLYEAMAQKWEEFSGEQFAREVEALKCSDMAAACRAEWKRWKVRINQIQQQEAA